MLSHDSSAQVVSSYKLDYCLGVLLLFTQLLLVLGFVQPMQFGNFSCSVSADQQGSASDMGWLRLRGIDKVVVTFVYHCGNTGVPTPTTKQRHLKLMQLLPWDALHITNETSQQKKICTVKHQIWCEMCIDLYYGAVNFQLLGTWCTHIFKIFSLFF